MEALSDSVEFDGWKPLDFECFPRIPMDFFAYSFIRSNGHGEITRWETERNAICNDSLGVTIHERGPYDDANRYMAEVERKSKAPSTAVLRHMRIPPEKFFMCATMSPAYRDEAVEFARPLL